MFATALTVGVAVISCKKEQAVQTTAEVLDEKIPTDDESIANELFAMHAGLTKNDKGNNKIKAEVNQTPKEIKKAVFLIEAYLNYEYDDSTAFELTSIDTSYITIPATLNNNNKYKVDYAKFIEAYNHSEIETIDHQTREKLRLSDPTVVVIDIELVTPEDPKIPTKDFVTRVITVMGYQQQAFSLPYPQPCAFNVTDDYWKFNCGYWSGTTNFAGKCFGYPPAPNGYLSCAEKEIERRLNTCNNPCYFRGNYYINVNQIPFYGGSNSFPLIYWRPAPYGNITQECFTPTMLNDQRNAIVMYANQNIPVAKTIVGYSIGSFGAYSTSSSNIQNIYGNFIYGKCTQRRIKLSDIISGN